VRETYLELVLAVRAIREVTHSHSRAL